MACHLKQTQSGYQVLSWDAYGHGDDRPMVHRGWAIYEKQLFAEKMVTVCFMDPSKVSEWDSNIKASVLNQREFAEIWEDRERIDVSMGVSASTWFDAERRRTIESGAQGDSIAEHASVTWQDFDVALIMPEPYYDQRQYWFRIDKYASTEYRYALGKSYLEIILLSRMSRHTGSRDICTCPISHREWLCPLVHRMCSYGCTQVSRPPYGHRRTCRMAKVWYSLASAMFAHDNALQFVNPCEDMVAFLKACAPIAYTDYGKAISHFGGLRIAPSQAIEYAGCGRAKQLAWDRAYDEGGNLCYICYYDAGNSVYAGIMKSILTPEDRRELYNGAANPREELLGDTLELALGVLTMAIRYPNHFTNWGGAEGANACVRGIERSVWRYAAAEAIELLTADQPPRRDENIAAYIQNLTQGLEVDFEAVEDGDRDIRYEQPNEEVSAAPPMPTEPAPEEIAQPEEETEADVLAAGIRQGIQEQVIDMINFLEEGKFPLAGSEHTFCVACGSNRHTLRDCHTDWRPILTSLQHMRRVIQNYPDSQRLSAPRTGESTNAEASDADVSMEAEAGSVASSTTRRPKAKARPRQPTIQADVMLIRYDNPRDLAVDVARRRGKFLVCAVEISETGLESQDAVGKLIEETGDVRDRQLPQRGDIPRFAVDVENHRYVNAGYSCTSDHLRWISSGCKGGLQTAVTSL